MDYSDLYESANRNKCSIMDLLPVLIDIDIDTGNVHVSPSCFMNEMQLSTEQRLEKLNQPLRKIKNHQLRALKVHPDIVIFQNFKPGTIYTVPLKLVNVQKVSVPIKLSMEHSAFFSVKHASSVLPSKIASGMSLKLEVTFSADDFKDYNHEITFRTEQETFDVKLIAIGPRPLLDLPDRITFPTTAVNIQTEKTVLVRNLGCVPAKFVIETSPPFTVDAERDTIKPDVLKPLTIYFTPTQLGYVKGHLKLRYETGEILSIALEADAEEASVYVSVKEVAFKDTYIAMNDRVELVIRNESDYKLSYKWKRYGNEEDEVEIKERLKEKYAELKDYEVLRSNRLNYHELAEGDANAHIYKRILKDELVELDKEDCFYFSDECFNIFPLEGELWPHSHVNVSLVFAPKVVNSYEKFAFLQINGLLRRIPIKLSGSALGPQVHVNVDEIDVGSIFIRAMHNYEILFMNTGPIPGNVRYNKTVPMFGGVFECNDDEFLLEPNMNRNVVVKFISETRGKFTEDISFTILESGEVLKFVMTGRVICPLLNVNCSEIDFHNIPIGCPRSCEIILKNPCQVPIGFNIYIPDDGDQKAYTMEEIIRSKREGIFVNSNTKQFNFRPVSGEVEAYGEITLTISVLSNLVNIYMGELVIGMWSSRKYSRSIPIRYTSMCPELVCPTPTIEMLSMFIKQPYCRILTLENRSGFPGLFCVSCETDNASLDLSIGKKCHHIKAYSKMEFRLIISSDEIGSYNGSVSIYQFGADQSQIICEIVTKARGPSVDINCEKIIIGEIPTLTLIQKSIPISNDSPIRADVTFTCSGDFLSTLEQYLSLEPEETGSFTLQIYGTVPGNFKNLLKIIVEDGDVDTYPVVGTCVGGSILCEPKLEPMLELGTILTEVQFDQEVKLTNRSKKMIIVYFSQHALVDNIKKVVEPPSDITIEPRQLDLLANECKTVTIRTMSEIPCEMIAIFYMHTKGSNKLKNSVSQFYVQANFEEPTISYDKSLFEFYIDFSVDVEHKFLEDTLTLLNCTNTELTIKIVIDKHFFMTDTDDIDNKVLSSTSFVLRDKKVLRIIFEPPVCNQECITFTGAIMVYYKNHPKVDKISLEGQVNYPDIEFQPDYLEFHCVPENASSYTLVLMKNVSPLKTTFDFKWHSNDYYLQEATNTCKKKTHNYNLCKNESNQTSVSSSNHNVQNKTESTEEELYKEKELRFGMQHLLIPLVEQFTSPTDSNITTFYKKILEKEELPFISKVIDIVPSQGSLEPFECQYLSISVRPPYKQMLEARLTCQVQGGETKTLMLKMESGDFSYAMDQSTIDLGIVHFNAICSKEHDLENTGCVPFYFDVNRENVWFEFKPVPRWLNVYPQNGFLKSSEKVSITIDYFPGHVGYFHEKIKIEIGYDDTIELNIVGCAVFPQVYFHLPRPYFDSQYMNRMSYGAIRELIHPEHCSSTYSTSVETSEPNLEGWVTITPREPIPSDVDISMALERRLIKKFLIENPQVISASFYNPSAFIPSNYVPFYSIDLAYVCVDSLHQVELSMVQYKPFNTLLLWPKLSTRMVDKGFSLFYARGHPNRFLLFNPNSNNFKRFEEELHHSFHVIVQGGLKIEFQVRAVVTRPQLAIQHEIIKFGHVKCGYCLKKTIILGNGGNIPFEWNASLDSPGKKSTQNYYLRQSEGSLGVGEQCLLDVYFEPRRDGKIVSKLLVALQYADTVVVALKGFGMLPRLDIVEAYNVFNPAIPYSLHNKVTTTVTNWCSYPVEIFFVEFDRQSEFEDEVVWTLCEYYNVQKLYTKPRQVGEALPAELIEMYYTILDKLKRQLIKLIQNEYRRQLREFSITTGDESSNTPKGSISSEIGDIQDPLQNKSNEELRLLLKVNMKKLRGNDNRGQVSENEKKMVIFDEEPVEQPDPTERKEGVLLIFHGAPETDYIQAANRIGRVMRLPVYSIDQLIFEALISSRSLAAIKVNEDIQKAFVRAASENEMAIPPDLDAYEELQRKIDVINRGKLPDIAPKSEKDGKKRGKSKGKKGKKDSSKDSKKTKSKSSGNSSKKSSEKKGGKNQKQTFLGLSKDLFFEMIKSELATFERGLVIENLTSMFVKQPHFILMSLLTSVGHIRFIQFVYFSFTLNEHAEQKKTELEEAELYTPTKKERVNEILGMNQDEFDALSEYDLQLFKKYVVRERKLETLRKRQLLMLKREGKQQKEVRQEMVVKHKSATEKVVEKSSSKGSKKSSKGSKKSSQLLLNEYEQQLMAAEMQFFFIQHILEHWDKKNGKLLKPLPDKPPKNKKNGKVSAKSSKSRGSSKKGSKKSSKGSEKKGSKKGTEKSTKSSKKESKKGLKDDGDEEAKEEVPVEPPKIEVKILSSEEALEREYTGIPLIVIAGKQPYDYFVPDYLSEMDELVIAVKQLEKSDGPKLEETETMYTILKPNITENLNQISDVFVPYDTPLFELESVSSKKNESSFGTITSDNASIVSSRTSKEKSKNYEKSEGTNSLKRCSLQSSQDTIMKTFTPRFILQTHDKVSFDFHFVPKKCGEYAHTYHLKIVSCGRHFPIRLEAKADIPRIYTDLQMMFPHVFQDRCEHEFESGYLIDEGLFNFGPVFAQNTDSPISCLFGEEQFNIISNSYVPSVVSTDFLESTPVFTVENEPNGLLIHPNNSQFLQLKAHPRISGTFEGDLIITIRNNPAVYTVKLACVGSPYEIKLVPNDVVFERVLLGVLMKKKLVLRNSGMLAVNWIFRDPDDVFLTFRPNLRKGFLKPQSNQTVQFEYKTSDLADVPRMEVEVVFYDKNMSLEDPIIIDVFQVSAEVVDILIEYVPEIDLQEVKVCTDTIHHYKLLNKSKYELNYSVELLTNPNDDKQEATIKNYFSVDEAKEGMLKINQPHEVKLKFNSKKPVKFSCLPVFTFRFFDVIDLREVHRFDLKVSAKSCGSSFKLCPPHEVNFGHQLIQTEASKEIILKNTGRYGFTYAVLSAKYLDKLKKKQKKTGKKGKGGGKGEKKSKSEKSSKSAEKKKKSKDDSKSKSKSSKTKSSEKGSKQKISKPTTLKEGIFSLVSSTGKIEPGEVEVIRLTCKPKKVGDYEDAVIFYISESFGKKKNGQTLMLRAKGCIPKVDTSNFAEMFKEIRVVEKFSDVIIKDELLLSPMFVIESKELHFTKTCLNVSAEVRMKLMNAGLIGAGVFCRIAEGEQVFSVEPTSFHVDPYKSEHVVISFKPVAIQKFHGILEIGVNMDSRKFTINLIGEGCLPEITMLEPKLNTINKAYTINFNPLMIGSSASKNITFRNVGVLPCKILLGIQNDENGMFFLIPKEYPMLLQKLCDQEYLLQEFNHTVITELKPGEESTVELQFKPNSEVIVKSVVKLYIINNPFEVFEILINGEGYKEDVVIEGLETTNQTKSHDASINSSNSIHSYIQNSKQLYYDLNFGYRFINKLHRICFKIKNISEVDTYKFSFANLDKITFLPGTGHLKPLACKDVIVAIYSKCPIFYDRIIIQCRLCKIKYLLPEQEPLSWDERQHFTIWKPIESDMTWNSVEFADECGEESLTHSTKIKTIRERTEPPIEEIPGGEKNIKIYFSVVLDYCSYSCDFDEIDISDTPLFEKKTATFVVSNTSHLPIELEWDLVMSENYPKATGKCASEEFLEVRNVSSRIRPQTGVMRQTPVYLSGKEKFLDTRSPRPKSSCTSSSTTFSTSTVGNVHDSWTDFHLNPFAIEPPDSAIPPGDSTKFTVTFSPFEVYEYAIEARAQLLNLKPGLQQPKVTIHAKSLLPLYHFNIKPSNYLKVRQESTDTCGYVVDESVKIIEFESIGIGVPTVSKFTIINPTGEDFSFKWEHGTKGCLSLFQCLTPEGFVTRGKMAEASFVFVPTRIGVVEALYVFFIEKYDLRTDFLLVGKAREPAVYFKRQTVVLKPTVVGIEIFDEIVLRNDEGIALKYNFKKLSLYSEGRLQKVGIVPFKGVIDGNGEEKIRINFNPNCVGPATFNIECKIEKLEKPLAFLLEGNCFEVQPTVTYLTDFSIVELDCAKVNVIELPSLIPLRVDNVNIRIANVGRIGFYYKWELTEKYIDEFVKVDCLQKEGYVKTETVSDNVITLKPIKHLIKKTVSMCLKISYGPTFNINFVCSTCRTKFKFSFKEYDFGQCLVQTARSYFYETALEITNNDPSPITIDSENEIYDHLTIINKANTIQPKKSGVVVLYFHPIHVHRYETEITISVNGKAQKVIVYGEGVPLEVELLDPAEKLINLGPVSVGKSKRRTVRVVNRSKCPIIITFELLDRLKAHSLDRRPVLEADFEKPEIKISDVQLDKKKMKGKKDKKDKKRGSKKSRKSSGSKSKSSKSSKGSKKSKKSNKSSKSSKNSKKSKSSKSTISKPDTPKETAAERELRLIYQFVKVNPTKCVKLFPEQVTEFTLSYSPTERMPLFTDQVYYQVQYETNPICMFKSCCVAPEYHLDQERVSFGTVIKGCSSEALVKLFNIGDVGGKYKWNISKKTEVFTISPSSGYITPNMAVTFAVKFSPTYTHCLFRTTAQCVLENFGPLNLELLGTCISLPAPKQTLKFQCQVRERDQKTVSLKNPTGYDWTIVPSLSGQYFNVDSTIIVRSADSATIPVTYHPLTMTLPNKKHESTLFLPLPEGQGVLYNLIGETTRPKTLQKIEKTIAAKSYHTELLIVENWLHVPQQFAVINQIEQPEKQAKVLYKLSGNSVIDVPPLESRTYKWIIYPLNDGKLNFKVKFRNSTTNEYLVYEIVLTITKAVSLEVIRMTTCARQKARHKIMLQNPIKQPAMFTISSICPDLYFKNVLQLDPYTTEELLVEYAPLVAANELTTIVEGRADALGTFPYTFVLTALPAQPEATIYFEAQLGMSDTKTVYLYNPQEKKADFVSKISEQQFTLDLPVSIPAREKGAIQLTFEPDNLGGFNSKIILTSPTLGEFMYPLIGNCTEPKPIGPYLIKEGPVTAIPFKNPFNVWKNFNFSVEPPLFYVKNTTEYARAKAMIKIYVGLTVPINDKDYPMTGKLYVSCDDEELADVKWVIYVKTVSRKEMT